MEVPVKGMVSYHWRTQDLKYDVAIQRIKGRAYEHGIEVRIDKDLSSNQINFESMMNKLIQVSGYAAVVIDDGYWNSVNCRHEAKTIMACGLAVDLFVMDDLDVDLEHDQCGNNSCEHVKCSFYRWYLDSYGPSGDYYRLSEASSFRPRTYQFVRGVDRPGGDRDAQPCGSMSDARQHASKCEPADNVILHYSDDHKTAWWKNPAATGSDKKVEYVTQFTPLVIRGVDMPGNDVFNREVSSVHEARYVLNNFRMRSAGDPRSYWGFYRHGNIWIKKAGHIGASRENKTIMILT